MCITVDSIEHPQHPCQWRAICSTISSTNFTLNVASTLDLASIVYCCAVLCYDKLHCAPASTLLALALPMSTPCLKSSSSKTCNVPSAIATPVSAPSRSRQCSWDARAPDIHLELLRLSALHYRDQPARYAAFSCLLAIGAAGWWPCLISSIFRCLR